VAQEAGFRDLPFLYMQIGTVLRLKGESRQAAEVFSIAMEELSNVSPDTLVCV
jgi:hypothetical protein